MYSKVYVEITNRCNMNCSFCHGHARAPRSMTKAEFLHVLDQLREQTKYIYYHLMGEPLLHAHLPAFIAMAREKGFIPVITTNGTLVSRAQAVIDAKPHKVQISLHSQEGNGLNNFEQYIGDVMRFAMDAASNGVYIVLRLWNRGGLDSENERLLNIISGYIPQPWTVCQDGWRIADHIYIEFGRKFDWPASDKEENGEEESFCYALRNQIGVLVDGTVVPCCLDSAGTIALGNLFEQSLDDVLATPRARAIYDGFTRHKAVEPLCRRCGYASLIKRMLK